MEEKNIIRPYFDTYENPAYKGGEGYTHFEIQNLRELSSPDGELQGLAVVDDVMELTDEELDFCSVVYGIYGRCNWGGSEYLTHYDTLTEARRVLRMIGVVLP